MKRLWKIVKAIGANLPFVLFLAAAFYFGVYHDDKPTMYFWIIMDTFYMVLRELYEIRSFLKKLFEDVTAEAEAAVEERINTDELPLQNSELREIRIILERLVEDDDNGGGRHSGSTRLDD